MNEELIRRDERFSNMLISHRTSIENLRNLQEHGMPVYNDGHFSGIWCTGKSTSEYVNWHYLSFNSPSFEFNIGNPQLVISIPRGNFIWTIKNGIPCVLIT